MKKLILPFIAIVAALGLVVPVRALQAAASTTTIASATTDDFDHPLRRAFRGALQDLLAFRNQTPLTAAQRSQLRAILANHRPEITAQILAMRDARAQIHQLNRQATVNPIADKAAADRLGNVARDGAILRMNLAREIRPILTAEQLQRLDSGIDAFNAEIGKLAALP